MSAYVYTLKNEDLESIGLTPTNATEYSIEQSFWFGTFSNMYEWHPDEYVSHFGELVKGLKRGNVIVKGDELKDEQKTFIIHHCHCDQY
jgi:hypothetical protein